MFIPENTQLESQFVQASPVRLEYFEYGQSLDTLVFVHGYATSAAIWSYTLENMSPARFRVIVLNNRGAGNSDRTPNEEDYSVGTMADDLFQVVEALNLDGFTLVGHSMGGAISVQFALEHQDRIKGMALINCASLVGQSLPDDWEFQLRRDVAAGLPRAGEFGFKSAHVSEDFKRSVLADVARTPIERYVGSRRSIAALRLRDRLEEIQVPTLVIGTDNDIILDIDTILADYMALPHDHRHLQVYHGCGHSLHIEVPQRVGGVLGRFSKLAWDLDAKVDHSR